MRMLLELRDKIWGPPKPSITHKSSDAVNMGSIPNDVIFKREGSGSTTINGAVGQNVNLEIYDSSSLRIIGNIGTNCTIHKEGTGTLTIEGTVAEDLQITVWGRGIINFTQRPLANVINSIKNRGDAAQFTCAGSPLEIPSQGYRHHNLGGPARQVIPQQPVQSTQVLAQLSNNRPSVPLIQEKKAEDTYNPLTEKYIERHKNHETIDALIKKLNLNEEEEELFESCRDCLLLSYFDDIPVEYDGKYYNLACLLQLKEQKGIDPFSREPITLASIGQGRDIYNKYDDALIALHKKRETATKQNAADQHNSNEEQSRNNIGLVNSM